MIQELIVTAELLCANLDKAIQAEKDFAFKVTLEFEKMRRQQLIYLDNLTAIKERFC